MTWGRIAARDRRHRYTTAMRKPTSLTLVLLLMAATLATPSTVVPRPSPEFTIHEPSGKDVLLSSFKGKVVMIEFLFLRSEKCLNLASTMNKLNAEFGSRGFQPVAVAFPTLQSDASPSLVAYIVNNYKLTYPVGYANKEEVDQYLSRAQTEMLRIPQVVIIDRSRIIRVQTGGQGGNLMLENEAYLRSLLDGLLKESPAPAAPAKQPSTQKSHKSQS